MIVWRAADDAVGVAVSLLPFERETDRQTDGRRKIDTELFKQIVPMVNILVDQKNI